jgi:DNA polymerase-3 subunit alpha
MKDFYVGLHRHSAYSRLDAIGLPEQVIPRLKELGQTACGITDHGTLFGIVPFYNAMRAADINPVIGCEMYICENMHIKGAAKDKKQGGEGNAQKIAHITILAHNQLGYKNLLKLYRASYETGFYYKPRIDADALIKNQEGLVVLSGCVGGIPSRYINEGKDNLAYEWINKLNTNIEKFFIEIVPCSGLAISYTACRGLWKIAEELNIPTVLSDDAHFPRPEDHETEDAAVMIGLRTTNKDINRKLRLPKYHYHCSGEEILQRAQEVLPSVPLQKLKESAAKSTMIAESCAVELPRGRGPLFQVPADLTAFDLLKQWVEEGIVYRRSLGLLPADDSIEWQEYTTRTTYELDIVRHHAFSNYFLMVADIVRWANKNKYWCIARGSCGGSLLCWLLGITQIDPIQFKLPVERFIDKSRSDMPDIDLDFDAHYRDKCFEYLESKYGKEHCAQIAALSTFRARQSIRDVCEVYDIPEWVGQAIVRMLPELDNEGGIKDKGQLAALFQQSEGAQTLLKQYPALKIAADLEGQVRAQSVHAAGFVVDQEVLEEIVGVEAIPGKARVIACDMNFAAQQGFLKIDALSVEMMSGVAEILDTIGHDFDWLYRLPLDDKATYEMLSKGRNMGVFQFKGHSSGKLLLQLQPDHINDLVALAALGRPGPLQSGGAAEYIERKHNRMAMPDYHPKVMEILGDTYGVIIYQEQVMGLMRVAGFDWPDVHKVRKLIAKSGGALAVEKYHAPYLKGMRAAGVPKEEAEHLWLQCQKAGGYVFNRAHGAMYGLHGYWTAYLKCRYPGTFACIMANHEKKEAFQRQILREFKQQGGNLLLLDPNRSERKFSSPEPNTILGGFETIKGVGPNHAEKMIAKRPYRDWTHFLLNCPTALAHDLQAAGAHTGTIDLDSTLVIAPWFVDVKFLPIERAAVEKFKPTPIVEINRQMEQGGMTRVMRIVGRITDLQLSTTKKAGKPGVTSGANERLLVTLTDETGSIDIWFSAWKWEELKVGRKPLRGPTEGIGNSVYVVAVISDDRTRLFGEDIICFRESKGLVHAQTRAALQSERNRRQKNEQEERNLFATAEDPQCGARYQPKGKGFPGGALAHLEAQLRDLD